MKESSKIISNTECINLFGFKCKAYDDSFISYKTLLGFVLMHISVWNINTRFDV